MPDRCDRPASGTTLRATEFVSPVGASSWGHRWALELSHEDGTPLGRAPLVPDWEPALEWLRLLALRMGAAGVALERVEPRWHERHGPPYVRGVRVAGGEVVHEVAPRYFGDAARAAAARLVDAGALASGAPFRYRLVALPAAVADRFPAPARRFRFEELEPPPCRPGRLAARLAHAIACDDPRAHETPALLAAGVLRELAALAHAAGASETGGVLAGHLSRDVASGAPYVEITGLVAARHAIATAERVTFTPATWAAARAALDRRGAGERMVGWAHSHPAATWCAGCSPEVQRHCRLASGFLSADDRVFHRAVFPAAWSVALVVTLLPGGGERHTLFGWDEGVIRRRGYHLVPDGAPPEAAGAREESDG